VVSSIARAGAATTPARLLACAALGAVLGTMLDGIHAYGGVLSYDDRAFGRWAWFVPVEFALVGAVAALAVPVIERATASSPRWTVARRALEAVWFACLYATTTLPENEAEAAALGVALLALAAVRLRFGPRGDLPYVVLAAIAGPLAEILISASGAFEYDHADVLGVPLWLPGLWANAGFLVRRLIAPIAAGTSSAVSRPLS
jgi:hypothetical protein